MHRVNCICAQLTQYFLVQFPLVTSFKGKGGIEGGRNTKCAMLSQFEFLPSAASILTDSNPAASNQT